MLWHGLLTGSGTIGGQQDNTGVTVNGLRATDNNFLSLIHI